jgi:type II secretory pathway component PulF
MPREPRNPPHPPLDYGAMPPPPPPPAYPQRRRFVPGTFLATAGVMLILTAILTLVMPRIEVVYKDFGVKLPAVTRVVLSAGRSLGGVAAWIVAIPLSLLTAYVVATLPIGGRALRLTLTLVLAGVTLAIALALFLPLISLADSLYAPPP